jgi:hypothetical protein
VVENTENDKLNENSYRLSYRIAISGKLYKSWS